MDCFDKDESKLILEALNAYLDWDDDVYNIEIHKLINKINYIIEINER
tara:strand:+ start:4929 stop:5072 length:144 start_codon:yes stop_codon:yes gene_type:complete